MWGREPGTAAHQSGILHIRRAHGRTEGFLARHRHPARNIEIRSLLDTFFVCAVATILIIRLQLWATNYPKLGGGQFHIAHAIYGGLAMPVAIVLLLSFLGRARRYTGAILGGVGFGFFIDELGKFITTRNDYFFKPTAGIIYIIFILMFLAIRSLGWRHVWTRQECLTNAMQLLADAPYRPLGERERALVQKLLGSCDQTDPLIPTLRNYLKQLEAMPPPPPTRAARIGARLRRWYLSVRAEPWFQYLLALVFVVVAVVTITRVTLGARSIFNGSQPVRVISVAALVSTFVASAQIWIGITQLRKSRLVAYKWWDHALLVQVFLADVFAFLQNQFAAVFGLLLHMGMLLVLRTMIHAENHESVLSADPLDAVEPLEEPLALPSAGASIMAQPSSTV
jgi:hypothetical protein